MSRGRWGFGRARDYVALLERARALQPRFPNIRLTDPACIDFEYAYVVSTLQVLPEQAKFAALSHHLYVDRRGHPENPQGRFSTLEKCALLRAIAQDRKSTRLNSSHVAISYAVFCLKKKTEQETGRLLT